LNGLFYVFLHQNTVYLAFPYEEAVLTHCHTLLQRVAPFSKVVITHVTEWQATGVVGPVPTDVNMPTFTLPTPTEAHLIFSQTPPSLPYPQKSLTDWHAFEFENKLPYITATILEQLLPHDINVVALGGVNFKKGCYLGQEIIARMHYKGSLKKQLQLVKGGEMPKNVVNALKVEDEWWWLVVG
jgi:folate-binding protein YgfZ